MPIVFLLVLALMCTSLAVQAQTRGGDENDREGPSYRTTPVVSDMAHMLAVQIKDTNRWCQGYDMKWRVDCLRDGYARIAAEMPTTGAYAGMRADLAKAARALGAIARRYEDPTTRPAMLVRRQLGKDRHSGSAVRATAPGHQRAAGAAARQVLDDLATQLLRSAPQGQAARFSGVVEAVAGAKTLLRSA